MNRTHLRPLLLAVATAAACQSPDVAPALDQAAVPDPGVVQGSVVYSGTARGDAVLLLFDTSKLPPPDGNGTSAVAVARVSQQALFGNAPATSAGPFSAPFVFTQVPSNASYQIRAFIDATHDFNPFFDFTQQPRAGDPVGGYLQLSSGPPQLASFAVTPRQVVSGLSVGIGQPTQFDPPSFVLAGGSASLDANLDRPARLRIQIAQLTAPHVSFTNAHFAVQLDTGPAGQLRSAALDGLPDVFPRVILRQLTQGSAGAETPVAAGAGAIVPCRVIPTPLLPVLLANPAGGALSADTLDLLVEPLALKASDLSALPSIPAGQYQVVVIQKSGQVWTLPNSLGSAQLAGTNYATPSQAQSVRFTPGTLPAGSISGNVVFQGSGVTSGNIIVQAYLDDPYHPPPPRGAAQPVRVQFIPASAVVATSSGFSAPFSLTGLTPGSNYIVQALDDVDGNFGAVSLLQTPTRGDLVGAVLDSSLKPASLTVPATGALSGQTLLLAQTVPLDPPAFELDPSVGSAQLYADDVTPARFGVVAKPLTSYPLPFSTSSAATTKFAVTLVRDAGGKPVDADGDGLPDVWPRAYLVRLDPNDPAGLAQFVDPDLHSTRTQIIPAAVDPTPFLAALHPEAGGSGTVVTSKLTILARPALLDATAPGAPPQRLPSLMPGRYKLVLVSQTGQVWQVPNEAGSLALDPRAICPASASSCAAGTVQSQSQGVAFQVLPPANPIFAGAISGTLQVSPAGTAVAAVYVFAYASSSLPPFGRPVTADYHAGAELQNGQLTYTLRDLPTGNYMITAVVDTRGDFAVAPGYLAAAPGPGSVITAYVDGNGQLKPVAVNGPTPGPTLTAVASGAGSMALPPRPSFELTDSGGTPLTSDAVIPVGSTGPVNLYLKGLTAMGTWGGTSVAVAPEPGTLFPLKGVSCDSLGTPLDVNGDGLADVTTSVRLVKVADAAGTIPSLDGSGYITAIPAVLDISGVTGVNCTSATLVTSLKIRAQNATVKVNPITGQVVSGPSALVAGRYQLVLGSFTGQTWRIPNELQPLLQDPNDVVSSAALQTVLATQGLAVTVQ